MLGGGPDVAAQVAGQVLYADREGAAAGWSRLRLVAGPPCCSATEAILGTAGPGAVGGADHQAVVGRRHALHPLGAGGQQLDGAIRLAVRYR